MIHQLLNNLALDLVYDEGSNISWQSFSPSILELVSGVEYYILLDNKEYTLTALVSQEEEGKEIVFIGNSTLEESEELPPFLIQYVYDIATKTYSNFIYYNGRISPNAITVSVDLEKVNIVLYDKKGKTAEYSNVQTISTDTVITGAQATFTRGTLVPPIETALDMKFGDQIVDANGSFFKQVTIVKPDSLIAENIKKNVEIGGVTGTFAGDEVEKTAQIDYSGYTPVYTQDEFLAFKKAENLGKVVRVMYEPGLFAEEKYLEYYKCVLGSDGTTYYLKLLKNDEVPIKSEYVILADEDTVLTQVTIPRHENLISANIKKGTDINGVTGSFIGNGYEYTENVLDFSTGKMVLTPDTDKQFSKITINAPPNLTPSNIKEGVSIAGVLGTYRLEGLPKLHPPQNISNLRDVATTAPYIHVPCPVTNGDFVKECQLFALFETNEDEVDVTTGKLVARASTNMSDGAIFYAENWLVDSLEKTSVLGAVFLGDNFTPSNMYIQDDLIVEYNEGATSGGIGITKVNYNGTNVEFYHAPEKIYWGQYLWIPLLPKDGFYLPKKIEVVDTGFNNYKDNYYYDNQTGLLEFYYNRVDTEPACFWEDEITFIADAPDTPWVNDFSILPTISDDGLLSIPRCDPKAARADISKDGRVIYSIDYGPINKKELKVAKTYRTNYTNVNQQNGYGHTMRNSSGYSNAYHVYRCTFNCQAPTQVTINYAQYRYSSQNCGFISKLDTVFTGNTTIEGSAKCLFYGPGTSTVTVTGQSLTVDIPVGTHTLDFKWVGKLNSTSYYFTFAINFPETDGSVTVDLQEIPELDAPGEHVLSITGELEGHTGTDPVEVIYTRVGATVEGENLNTIGTVEDETLVINYVTVEDEIIFYDPKEEEEVIT